MNLPIDLRRPPGLEWNLDPAERERALPCDELVPGDEAPLWRAVTVEAEPATVFRWLCQLRVAPYSYDLLDNLGRRSPETLTPGLEELAVGQPVMTIFEVASFERDRHLTIVLKPGPARVLGPLAVTYEVAPFGPGRTRLRVKLRTRFPGRALAWALRWWFVPLDCVMMRRQLLTLKRLAERSARS